jgi:hypothetical protein
VWLGRGGCPWPPFLREGAILAAFSISLLSLRVKIIILLDWVGGRILGVVYFLKVQSWSPLFAAAVLTLSPSVNVSYGVMLVDGVAVLIA